MPTMQLTRRKVQLELLTKACEDAAPTCVSLYGHSPENSHTFNTRLLAFEDDCLWVRWPHGVLSRTDHHGTQVDVHFEYEGNHYHFRANALGRFDHSFGQLGSIPALKLTVPIRVFQQERRESYRLKLTPAEQVTATLVHTLDRSKKFELTILDVSSGGLGGLIDRNVARLLGHKDLLWAEFSLSENEKPLDFIVRLVHMRPTETPDVIMVGWAFCPCDDEMSYRDNLRRLKDFVEAKSEENN